MDIQRALRYWQKEGLLSLEETADGKLCGIGLLPFPEDSTDTEEASSLLPRLLFLERNTGIRCRGNVLCLPACESATGTADPPLYAG